MEISYRVPELLVNNLVAGACFGIIDKQLGGELVKRWVLPRNGRRSVRKSSA